MGEPPLEIRTSEIPKGGLPDFKLIAASEYKPEQVRIGLGRVAESCAQSIKRRNSPAYIEYKRQTREDTEGKYRPHFAQTEGNRVATERVLEILGQEELSDRVNRDGFKTDIPSASDYTAFITSVDSKDIQYGVGRIAGILAQAIVSDDEMEARNKSKPLVGQQAIDFWDLKGRIQSYQSALRELGFPNVAERATQYASSLTKKETATEAIQPWVDKERLKANEQLIAKIKEELASGKTPFESLRSVIAKVEDEEVPDIPRKFDEAFTAEDKSGVSFSVYDSPEHAEIAGVRMPFPLFMLSKEASRKLHGVLSGEETTGTVRGFALDGDYIKDPFWSKTKLIISAGDDDSAEHEVRHGVDPYAIHRDRKGYDNVIAELFAQYGHKILRGADWSGYQRSISGKHYYDLYTKHALSTMSIEQWGEMTGKVCERIRHLQATVGDVNTQRKIVSSKTIAGLLSG